MFAFVLVPDSFVIHNICMKALIVYFHAVHFLNKLFLIKDLTAACLYRFDLVQLLITAVNIKHYSLMEACNSWI